MTKTLAPTPPRRPLDKPFEIFILAVCLVNGVAILVGGPRPASIQASLNLTLVLVWGWMLVVGSALALTGVFWRGRLTTSYLIEQMGLIITGGATLIYALAVVQSVGVAGLFAAGISLAFAFACIFRTLVIHKYINQLVVDAEGQ